MLVALDPSFRGFRCVGYGEQHARVGAATTEVAAESTADILDACIWILPDEGGAGHDKARRAEAALLGVVFDEGLLDLIHLLGCAQTFDGGDLLALASSASIEQE